MSAMKRTFLASMALVLTGAFALPACDSDTASPVKREDEGGDANEPPKKEEPKKEEPAKEKAETTDEADTKDVAAPKPVAPKPATTTAKADDTEKKADDTSTAGDDKKGLVGATPTATTTGTHRRGEGSGPGGECPCMRGFVCCAGTCKKSCN